MTQSVLATTKPFAQATSRLADVALPGLDQPQRCSPDDSSGVDDDGMPPPRPGRVAELSLVGGVVEFRGMDWLAIHGAGEEPRGTFTIGAPIAGVPLPIRDPSAVLDTVNAVLGPSASWLPCRVGHWSTARCLSTRSPSPSCRTPPATLAGSRPRGPATVREQLFGVLLALDATRARDRVRHLPRLCDRRRFASPSSSAACRPVRGAAASSSGFGAGGDGPARRRSPYAAARGAPGSSPRCRHRPVAAAPRTPLTARAAPHLGADDKMSDGAARRRPRQLALGPVYRGRPPQDAPGRRCPPARPIADWVIRR